MVRPVKSELTNVNPRIVQTMFLLCSYSVCDAKLDLAFVIDAVYDVQKGFPFITRFFFQLVDSFTISSSQVRVALITNSERPRVVFSFGQYNSPRKIKHILRLLQPLGEVRHTGETLMLALKQLFPASKRKKTVILLTAGKSSDKVLKPVQRLVAKGVDIFSIGVGADAVRSEILTMAKDPQHAYITVFSGLASIVKRIAKKACGGNQSYNI